MDKYIDIINLNHYEPKNHPRMTIDNRSAIFAPFAALTGYEDCIYESSRYVEDKILYLYHNDVINYHYNTHSVYNTSLLLRLF